MLSPLSRNTKIALATALVIMGCLLSCFAARGSTPSTLDLTAVAEKELPKSPLASNDAASKEIKTPAADPKEEPLVAK